MKMIILDLLIINIEINRIISAHSLIYDKTKWYEMEEASSAHDRYEK
jgi:hypothetical protein